MTEDHRQNAARPQNEAMQWVGEFTIGADHPSLAGHFPGDPIVPGVVLLERCANCLRAVSPVLTALLEVRVAKFTQVVRPGEPVNVWYRPLAAVRGGVDFKCETARGPAAQGTFVFAVSA